MSSYAGVSVITQPAVLPVTLTELKLAMGITSTAKDNDLTLCLASAIDYVEREAWTALINRTCKQIYDYGFPESEIITLATPPCNSVTRIQYYDTEGVLQTLDSTTYVFDNISQPSRIYPAFNEEFPDTACIPADVIITFVAGYGPSYLSIPPIARRIIIAVAADMFERVEVQSEFNLVENYTSKIALDSISFRRPF